MDWPASMTAYGVTVQRETLEAAWENWWARGTRTRLILGDFIFGVAWRVTREENACFISDRVAGKFADRMLQRARKAGVIRFDGKVWEADA